ncbi:MAG: hypothetical protein COV45_01005 [Deltaproteobacteria bacterium CG11_big_fil_rev_8_21_14_0_20_47_16]|nr:MAG: hypothetical protein COV45_01005 [Deltaproteobacteria bacterium CG11_big_fil_rev_8_21_14_0_20_47_16]
MHSWYKSHEDLPTVRLTLLAFCCLLALQGPVGQFTLSYSLGWGLILNQIGIMMAPVILLCRYLHLDTGTLFPLYTIPKQEWRWVLITTLCVVLLSDMALAFTEQLLPIPSQIQETLNQLLVIHSASDFLKKLFLFCILPAITEEIYFRGFIQTSLAHRIGPFAAILISALLFALAHGNIWYLHLYFGLGCFLGWIYEKSGSLWPTIVAHFINNAWTLTSHALGLENVLSDNIIVQLFLLVGLLLILTWSFRRWNLESIPIQHT